ncbi:hypothetical protein J4526_00825 [Desulfurococcaceae archaeon MEX13E-LK6-19]|nr:hypothetical protein J4526_00825 [Desulfurococcaceae archaeon MEX13E-LK6-19]
MSIVNKYIILRECFTGHIKNKNIDLNLTLGVYNYGFWFNGKEGIVILEDKEPVIAIINIKTRQYKIYSANKCSDNYIDKLEWTLGLKEDLSEFFKIAKNDLLLSLFATKYSRWRPRSTSLWWSLVIGVCQQNASFIQGWKMLYNIIKLYNRAVVINEKKKTIIPLPPSPEHILAEPEILVKARVGYRAKTIVNIAKHILKENMETIERTSSVDLEKKLTKIKGIGPYTARLALVLAFRKYDLPPVDRWLKKIIALVYNVDERHAEEVWVDKWGKWSGLAALAVTITLDAEPLTRALERIKNRKLLPEDQTSKPTPLNLWRFLK